MDERILDMSQRREDLQRKLIFINLNDWSSRNLKNLGLGETKRVLIIDNNITEK